MAKRYGCYANFIIGTSREEAEEALKKLAVAQLIDLGVLKIAFDDFPWPVDDEGENLMLRGGWKLEIPEEDDHE